MIFETIFVQHNGTMQASTKQHTISIAVQIVIWGVLFLFPLILTINTDQPMTFNRYLGYVFIPLSCMVIYYINYFSLIERTLFKKKVIGFLLINFSLIFIMGCSLYLWHEFYRIHLSESGPDRMLLMMDFLRQYLSPQAMDDFSKIAGSRPRPPAVVFIGRDSIMLILTIGLSVAVKMTGNWYKTENEKEQLKKAKAEAELQNLKNQLNPHFLFNTLNNIYSLIDIDKERAQEALYDLSRLLRYVLYDNALDQVPLGKELAFIKSFIELMSLRLPKTATLEIEIPKEDYGMDVAPMLFIPLIENAFKHGVSSTSPSHINIAITISRNHTINCKVRNSSFPKRDNDRSGSGIGLQNLERRLQLIYPGRYRFTNGRYGDEYVADLSINYN